MRRYIIVLTLSLLVLSIFATLTFPSSVPPGKVPGVEPDSYDYAYGAIALLHGRYIVDWDGAPHVPRYPPGLSLMLLPAVALGGVAAAVWTSYLAAILLGCLAALLATRLSRPAAAPLALALVLLVPSSIVGARIVMSDLPAAALVMLEALVLTLGYGRRSAIVAGALGGFLVWIRPASAALLVCGPIALSARTRHRNDAPWFVVGAAPLLLSFFSWQWLSFGSPLTTTYQAAGYGVGTLFSLKYLLGPPWKADGAWLGGQALAWHLPNLVVYPLQLVGADGFLTFPGIGLLGVLALVRFSRETGARGVAGRFGLAIVGLTVAVYLPFFWQSGRYLVAPSSILGMAGGTFIVDWLAHACVTRRPWGSPTWARARQVTKASGQADCS